MTMITKKKVNTLIALVLITSYIYGVFSKPELTFQLTLDFAIIAGVVLYCVAIWKILDWYTKLPEKEQ